MKRIALLPVLALALTACRETTPTSAAAPADGAPRMDAIAVTVNDAYAPSGTHLQAGTESCTLSGTTVSCTRFELAGVGHTNATARLVADYTATVDCYNPSDKNTNNPIESHQTSFSDDSETRLFPTKNGRLVVGVETASPTQAELAGALFCPNANWRPQIRDGSLQLVSFTYTVTFDGYAGAYLTITGP